MEKTYLNTRGEHVFIFQDRGKGYKLVLPEKELSGDTCEFYVCNSTGKNISFRLVIKDKQTVCILERFPPLWKVEKIWKIRHYATPRCPR